MKYTYFKIENFKGIRSEKLDFTRNPNSKIFTLVGLNESGKTTILEAINYFKYNPESLSALELQNYEITDIHNLVPIGDRDNFNGKIIIEAGIELDETDLAEIKKAFKKEINLELTDFSTKITYTQKYAFENSLHQKDKDELLWSYDFSGKKGNQRKVRKLENADALIANKIIKKRLPGILYFPNFLFEFPEKIYLDSSTIDPKHKYYQTLLQDILDSLDNGTNLETHILKRILSTDDIEKEFK
ncbi:MAG: AAA family ATPase [Saprospiraceae bacterium]|nr:AAA family ATPase [Saprospiraceae bacterium]